VTNKVRKSFFSRFHEFPMAALALEEIFTNYPTILMMCDRKDEALSYLEKCESNTKTVEL